jgi:transcriptional regulator with GAF, ATPase, and Fis domain
LLDEVGDLPLAAQAKLLRVLQEGVYEPVGSDRSVRVDVRILAATHVDLERAMREGRLRDDLYYRLAVFPVPIPALRERREDIAAIAERYLASLAQRTGRGPWRLTSETLEALARHDWPGNVRELVNCIERAAILHPDGDLAIELPTAPAALATPAHGAKRAPFRTLAEHERAYILEVLDATGGRVYGPDGAARILGLKPSTLQHRMKKLGIRRAMGWRPEAAES